ncbi:hypothetical protein EYC84_006786 [Monilinia fructicola]|uniref:FAD-binding domain-containing protein n=1 Tax=Monilinia fructicola TaxID=38448 RepID=A0A5M9K9D8_MONFR|nr:hypothetical protein EYC84_006786 [Monilinia fructicola]
MVPNNKPFPSDGRSDFVARVHRGRLEWYLMREFEKEIEWECEIEAGVTGSPLLVFPSHVKGIDSQGDLTFDCMGVHSPIKCAGGVQTIEPIVVFRGSTCFMKSLWHQRFQDWFRGNTAQIKQRFGETVLELSVDDFDHKRGIVFLTYIYSRHHTGAFDELWVPKRSNDQASSPFLIGKFLDEIKTFRKKHKLPGPYDEIFDPQKMKNDKIVHWLMRTNLAEQSKLIHLWNGEEKIYKLGDAAHCMPIVESTGAELAIRDGIEAAEQVEENGGAMLHRWLITRWPMKTAYVEAGRRNLHRRHF